MKGSLSVLLLCALLAACGGPEAAHSNDPARSAELNAQLGLRYMLQGQYELSMEKLQRALEHDDDSVDAHHYLGELYRRLDKPEEANRHFRRAVRLAPEASSLRNNYGVFLCEQRRYEEAEKQFNEVLKNPVYQGRAQTYENLGLCLLGHDRDRARQYLRQGLQINPRQAKSLLSMGEMSLEEGNALSARGYLQRYLVVARHTPQSLWLGIRVERILGDRDALASYGLLLKNHFPDAEETRRYLESR